VRRLRTQDAAIRGTFEIQRVNGATWANVVHLCAKSNCGEYLRDNRQWQKLIEKRVKVIQLLIDGRSIRLPRSRTPTRRSADFLFDYSCACGAIADNPTTSAIEPRAVVVQRRRKFRSEPKLGMTAGQTTKKKPRRDLPGPPCQMPGLRQ
jgi:hypothetical protein